MIPGTKKATKRVVDSFSTISGKKKESTVQIPNRSSEDPLRVAIVCPYSMTVPGGVQNQVLLMSKTLRSKGVDARIIAPCDGVPPNEYLISVGSTKSMKGNGSYAPIVNEAQSSARTLDAIDNFRPDIVHLHEPLVPGPTNAAMIGTESAMVATFHAAGQGIQALKYFRHPARGAVSRIHQRVAVSSEAENLASRYLPGDYKIIPNCIDIDSLRTLKPWPNKTKPTVLFVGRHEERKGLRFLIEAWIKSQYLQKNADLWVIGAGGETAELMGMSKDIPSISFLGRIDDDELFRRMHASDVVVAPALYGESFGIVLLEAMACSAAVIASNIPGYRDVARDGVEAILCEPGNSESLKNALEQLISDDELKNQLIIKGLERSKEFSAEKIVSMYIELYYQVLEDYKSKSSAKKDSRKK